ncbi:hypothetical protein TWF569_002942 [Orbilia oligospora]|nr:hypothetical protein TWF569_002942 [Orbilia oligospora]
MGPIDYYGTDDEDSDDLTLEDGTSFREFVNRLSKFQPTALRILNVRSFELVTHEAVWMKPEDRGEIRFPKGLDYISYHPKSCVARFRALDLLKASFDTLTTLEIPAWHSLGHTHIPGLVCPILRVVRLERHLWIFRLLKLSVNSSPNVEELFLLEVQIPNTLELEDAHTFRRDEEWSATKKLRKVQMEAYEIFEEDLSCWVEAVKDSTRALIEKWYADGTKDLDLLKLCVYDWDKCFELHLTYKVKRLEREIMVEDMDEVIHNLCRNMDWFLNPDRI